MTKKEEQKDELKCVWAMGTPCDGDVKETGFFCDNKNPQIKIPVCEKHAEEHHEIMILHSQGYDIEKVLQETPEWRKKEVYTCLLSGLVDKEDVDY